LWINDSLAEKKFDQLIELYDPNGQKLLELHNNPSFEKNKKRLRTLIQINGIKITEEGQYIFSVKYKEKGNKYLDAANIPLDIKFALNIPTKKLS
jgi:hypothetical protein